MSITSSLQARHTTKRFHSVRASSLALNERTVGQFRRLLKGLRHSVATKASPAVIETYRGPLLPILGAMAAQPGHAITVKAFTPIIRVEDQSKIHFRTQFNNRSLRRGQTNVSDILSGYVQTLRATVLENKWEAFQS